MKFYESDKTWKWSIKKSLMNPLILICFGYKVEFSDFLINKFLLRICYKTASNFIPVKIQYIYFFLRFIRKSIFLLEYSDFFFIIQSHESLRNIFYFIFLFQASILERFNWSLKSWCGPERAMHMFHISNICHICHMWYISILTCLIWVS